MEAAGYATLTRQSGLMREMQIVAHNIANAATNGYRAEGLVFSEFVRRTEGGPSLSMARGNIPVTSAAQGPLSPTGGAFDFAIEGEGFFLVETPEGERLTRAGAFSLSAGGDLVTADGRRVLDAGGAPVFVPPDIRAPGLAPDGTLSGDGRPLAQLGLSRGLECRADEPDRTAHRGATRLRDGPELSRHRKPARKGRARHIHPLTPKEPGHAHSQDRRDGHGRPADARGDDFQQSRQHVHHRLQRAPRRVRRPALSTGIARGHDQRRRRLGAAHRGAARARRAALGDLCASLAGLA